MKSLYILISFFCFPFFLHAGENGAAEVDVLSDIEVMEDFDIDDRVYTQKDGKRFFTKTYGDVESILSIANQTKNNGYRSKVSTRYLSMPQGHVGSYITQYLYTFRNGKTFLYLDSDSFKALALETDFGSVVIDVIDGASFSSPMLWGPYDQIAGYEKSSQQAIVGDGKNDRMGLLKSSYVVGDMAILSEEDYEFFGKIYIDAIRETISSF